MNRLIIVMLAVSVLGACDTNKDQQSSGSIDGQVSTKWINVGPGGGGAVFEATVNPADPQHVFIRCDMTGSYVSENGGESWRTFNLRTTINDFEFDSNNPDVVYASNTGLYRSENRGRSWKLIYPYPANVIEELMLGDHANHSFHTRDGMPDGRIVKICVDPVDSKRIAIGIISPSRLSNVDRPRAARDSVRIMVSEDRGGSWNHLCLLSGRNVLGIFPGSWQDKDDELLVFTEKVSAKVSRKTQHVKELKLPVEGIRCVTGGIGSQGPLYYILADPERVEGQLSGGIYRSPDGVNWQQASGNLLADLPESATLPRFKTVAVCVSQPELGYLSAEPLPVIVGGEIQYQYGTLKTEDAGKSWKWVYRAYNDSVQTGNYAGYWKDRYFGIDWAGAPYSYGISSSDPEVCYVTDTRTLRTIDGGKSWKQISSNGLPDGSATTLGYEGTTTYGVHFDPFDREHLFISYADLGLFYSLNGGKSWTNSTNGIPRNWRNSCYWMEFDPEVKDLIWTAWSGCHDLPRPKMYRGGDFSRFKGGVAISDNGGKSWQISNEGFPESSVCTHILLDPSSPVGSRTLYVCSFRSGIYKSTDGGKSWDEANTGLGDNRNVWRMTRHPSGTLYLCVYLDIQNKEIFEGGLYSSQDEGASWQKVTLPDDVIAPNDLLIDPENPERMYLSCWPVLENGRNKGGGLLLTEDSGNTWTRVFNEEGHVFATAIDPFNPGTVYINTFNSSAFRSTDYGSTWERIKGYNFKWGQRPVPDIHNPGMLYMTTFGGSVFYGPAEGTNERFEDIENLPAPLRP